MYLQNAFVGSRLLVNISTIHIWTNGILVGRIHFNCHKGMTSFLRPYLFEYFFFVDILDVHVWGFHFGDSDESGKFWFEGAGCEESQNFVSLLLGKVNSSLHCGIWQILEVGTDWSWCVLSVLFQFFCIHVDMPIFLSCDVSTC